MSKFLTPLKVEQIGARTWMLTDDLAYLSDRFRGIFIAPSGFQTDFASIPRGVWNLVPKEGIYNKVGVIHDAGYVNALLTSELLSMDGPRKRVFTVKSVADDLFEEGLKAVGVNRFQRWLMVLAVRKFGDPDGHPLAKVEATNAKV